MMISEKYKLVLIDYEYSTDFLEEIFKELCFIDKQGEYVDYKKVIFLITPYQKVLNFYMGKVLPYYTPIFKDKKNFYIKRFQDWVSKIFIHEKLVTKLKFEGSVEKHTRVLLKFKLENKNYDFIVRDYEILSDLIKIDDSFKTINSKIEYKWKINEFYDYKTAKIIFQFYKNEFFIGKFDPFSIFDESITNKDKIDFIHEPF